MSSLVVEVVQAEIGASVPWPDDAALYQPYEKEQILLTDSANCLSVKTFLKMCGLNFNLELRVNAEEMSPSGKIPFIKVGPFLISEMDPIIAFVNTKGFHISNHLSDSQQSEMRAYMALVESILINAELYLSWCHEDVYYEITKPRYGACYPWPLNMILPLKKFTEIKNRLTSIGWFNKSFEEVCEQIKTCCQVLSERLGNQTYFFGDKPTELDALVFGHLFTLLTTNLPVDQFALVIQKYDNLVEFCNNIQATYYK
ncbi:metaxin-2 [Octopus bimaculoides]|uniref:GST C-terminal domain-containing protein n=1 Tax=Octopus bimaculoides TaxID=37653 RepID=A0A0L8GA68_OCTBM|nr:metaxin-2 [Octopus bimaculoides]|eukprot:XP_014783077.1 PREDICTED: metaxin-2-like [Octopus bimaculoides]